MKFGSALAFLALAALTPPVPALTAKDEKLPRCNGRQKRPANLYGTVLPSIPSQTAPTAAIAPPEGGVPRGTPQPVPATTPAPATNLFPPDDAAPGPQGANTTGKVPAIGAVTPSGGPTAALSTSYASC
jgi:hypothetical protein